MKRISDRLIRHALYRTLHHLIGHPAAQSRRFRWRDTDEHSRIGEWYCGARRAQWRID